MLPAVLQRVHPHVPAETDLESVKPFHSDLAICYAMNEELCRLFSLRDVSQAASAWNAWFDAAKEIGIPALFVLPY